MIADNSSPWMAASKLAAGSGLRDSGDVGRQWLKLVTGVLQAASSAVEDGLSTDDVADLIDAAIATATANLALVKVDVQIAGVLEALGTQLSVKGVRALLTPDSRWDVIISSLETVARNPRVWSGFAEADLVQPLVAAVFTGLATDSTALLTGPHLVESVRTVLATVAIRGQQLIDGKVDTEAVQKLLTLGLRKVNQEIGRSIDGETLPQYLERLVERFLDDPFELDRITDAGFKEIHELAMGRS